MRRFLISLCVLILLITISRVKAFAADTDEIYRESGAQGLVAEESEDDLLSSVWDILACSFEGVAGGAFKYGGLILGCVVLLALTDNMDKLRDGGKGFGFDFVSAAVLAASSFPALELVFSYTKSAVEGLCAFSVSLLPVMTALYSMGGNAAQAVAASSGLSLFLTVTEVICAKLLLPVLSMGFAFALTGLLPGSTSLGPVSAFLKNAVCMLIAFVFSLICFVFYFQTAVSATADNLTYRSVKFASGAFIPLIGNAVGDSARTVFGAVSTVKSTVGVYGLTVMLTYLLPPIISAVVYKLTFAFCALTARVCGLEKQAKFLSDIGALLGVSMALLIAASVVFTVISAVFLKSGVSL